MKKTSGSDKEGKKKNGLWAAEGKDKKEDSPPDSRNQEQRAPIRNKDVPNDQDAHKNV